MSRLQHSVDTLKKTPSIAFEPPQYYQPQHPLFQQAEGYVYKSQSQQKSDHNAEFLILICKGTIVGTVSKTAVHEEKWNLLETLPEGLKVNEIVKAATNGKFQLKDNKNPGIWWKNNTNLLKNRKIDIKKITDIKHCTEVEEIKSQSHTTGDTAKSRWSKKHRNKIKLVTAFKKSTAPRKINDWLETLYLAVRAGKHAKVTAKATKRYVLKIRNNENLENILTWDPIFSKINMIINNTSKTSQIKLQDFKDMIINKLPETNKTDRKIALARISLFLGKLIRTL